MISYNPLLPDFTTLKDSEIEDKIIDLSKKYHTASRFGQGSVCEQIIAILNNLREEQSRRNQALLKKTQGSGDKDLGSLINVD